MTLINLIAKQILNNLQIHRLNNMPKNNRIKLLKKLMLILRIKLSIKLSIQVQMFNTLKMLLHHSLIKNPKLNNSLNRTILNKLIKQWLTNRIKLSQFNLQEPQVALISNNLLYRFLSNFYNSKVANNQDK